MSVRRGEPARITAALEALLWLIRDDLRNIEIINRNTPKNLFQPCNRINFFVSDAIFNARHKPQCTNQGCDDISVLTITVILKTDKLMC